MSLYECDRPGCEWRNQDWRYGFADAGSSYHYHLAEHEHADADECAGEHEAAHEADLRTYGVEL